SDLAIASSAASNPCASGAMVMVALGMGYSKKAVRVHAEDAECAEGEVHSNYVGVRETIVGAQSAPDELVRHKWAIKPPRHPRPPREIKRQDRSASADPARRATAARCGVRLFSVRSRRPRHAIRAATSPRNRAARFPSRRCQG